ncbi:MAG: DUF2924 domain-containing protein [Holosporaceae bacterium]|jgi:hypothetical protein|nr:DUF2924 domain-containing protein [Holosporaceae bacterium]
MAKIEHSERNLTLIRQIMELQNKKMTELKALWDKMFDHPPEILSRQYMISKLAWRTQELIYGGLDEVTQIKIREAERKIKSPKNSQSGKFNPMVGSKILKEYKGKHIEILVVDGGFSYAGEIHKSLSAIATKITGTKWNGLKFFNVGGA